MSGIYHRSRASLLVVVLGLAMGSCAVREPTFGDRLETEGTATAKLAEQWNLGDDMVREGTELRDSGVENVSNGEAQVVDGKAMIVEGERLRREAEDAYGNRTHAHPAPASN